MTAPKSVDRPPVDWSEDDLAIEQEFAEVISFVRQSDTLKPVPKALDRSIKQIARGSALDELEQSWLLSNGAKLTLTVLVFFAIAMLWLSL